MAKPDFRLFNYEGSAGMVQLKKDPATVVGPGKFVTLDGAWLAIEADATSTKVAFAPYGANEGESFMLVNEPWDDLLILEGEADRTVADTDRGEFCDIAVSWGVHMADLDASTTEVLQVLPDERFGVDTKVRVKIAKWL